MKKSILAIAVASVVAVGCGRIETGEVGVRTDFNKTVEMNELNPGWYAAVLTSVDHYDIKETQVEFNDLTPKAKDNLLLNDPDISIFYRVNPGQVAELLVKYSSMTGVDKEGHKFPAYLLLERVGRGAVYDSVSKFDSLTMHTKRSELEKMILDRTQEDLDRDDKGTFTVTKVIVRNLATDPALEASIQAKVRVENKINAKKQQIELAKAEAERIRVESEGQAKANQIIANSITNQLIELRRIEAMREFAGKGTHTVVMPADTKALVNIK